MSATFIMGAASGSGEEGNEMGPQGLSIVGNVMNETRYSARKIPLTRVVLLPLKAKSHECLLKK